MVCGKEGGTIRLDLITLTSFANKGLKEAVDYTFSVARELCLKKQEQNVYLKAVP